jgi:hypothetical protein
MRRRRRSLETSRLGYHVRLTPIDGGVIATTPAARRVLARAVHESCGAAGLLAFGLADNHLHLLLCGDRAQVSKAAMRLAQMLGWRLSIEAGFQPAYIKPIRDGAHLFATFRYVMRQGERHRLDPAADPWMEATSVPDLLGLRPLGAGAIDVVKRALPRLTVPDVLEVAHVRSLSLLDGPLEEMREAGRVVSAHTTLKGKQRPMRQLRRAMIALVGERLGPDACATLVGVGASTLRRVRQEPVESKMVLALRRALGFIGERRRALSVKQT